MSMISFENGSDCAHFVATCLFGLEGLLGEELSALGFKRTGTIDGRLYFDAPLGAIPILNISLRYAERVYVEVGRARAESFTDLFDCVKSFPWEDFIGFTDAFPVKGHSIKSRLVSIPDCQKIIKKSVATRLSGKYRSESLPETGIKKQIEFFIFKDEASLMIDTSGVPLHKRGYRTESNAAPLRETLAAAIAKLSRPRDNVLFVDPMCGSGTIPIEAALMMTNTAPGLFRSFASEEYGWIDASVWKDARDLCRNEIREIDFRAIASDISPEAIDVASRNVARSGMGKYIECRVADALSLETGGRRGTVVCNPPYGERLSDVKTAVELYGKMGRAFLALDNWQLYILTNDEDFERHFGYKSDKTRKLYNGMIPCRLYQYFKKRI